MGRSRINTLKSGVTPSVLYTPYFLHFLFFYTLHFLHSAFCTLLIFYTSQILHSALHVFHRTLFSLQISPFKFLSRSQIDHRKQRKAFFQDLLEVLYIHYIAKGFLLCPKIKIKCMHCRWPGRNDKLCTRLFHAPPTQVF